MSLGIFRSDYLIDATGGLNGYQSAVEADCDPIYIKQVEMNTISLGGITASCIITAMHR